MTGYWNDPLQTEKRFRQAPETHEVWLHTGDVLSCDEDGFLFFHGRSRDFIKTGGIRVSIKEVEKVIGEQPGVVESAVIPFEDAFLGTAMSAAVVANRSVADERTIEAMCRKELTGEGICPQSFVFLRSMPKTENGKIDRAGVAAIITDQLASSTSR